MTYPQVAVCIPTYNLGKKSLELLEQCLTSVEDQEYPGRLLVVISDNSDDYDIYDYLQVAWSDYECKRPFDLTYTRFAKGAGVYGVPNMNNSFDCVPDGALIKPLNQDDFLKTPTTLVRMVEVMESTGAKWAACGCDHIDDDNNDLNYVHPPRWVEGFQLAYGLNHIGGLSVVMVPKDDIRQDENLMYLNDCDYYYRLGMEYGPPALIANSLVTVRMRKDGLSSTLDLDAIKTKEQRYLQKKYGVT